MWSSLGLDFVRGPLPGGPLAWGVTKPGDGARTVTKVDDDTAQPTFVTMRSGSSISKLKHNLIASSNRCMGKGSSDVVDEK